MPRKTVASVRGSSWSRVRSASGVRDRVAALSGIVRDGVGALKGASWDRVAAGRGTHWGMTTAA